MTIARKIGVADGAEVQAVTLGGSTGPQFTVMSYGARLTELWVPGRDGVRADIVLGCGSLADYETSSGYLGATCGRFSNRIRDGRFVLDGREVQLDCNEGSKHLHGGRAGFDRKNWSIEALGPRSVTFGAHSADGEMGYPGRLDLRCTYALDARERLWITMEASTDAPTVINMVNHSYFNMAGHDSGSVMGQHLRLGATHYTPVDADLIPTGEIRSVAGSAFDFTTRRTIGADLPSAMGFDHNLCLTGETAQHWGAPLRFCAEAVDPASGRRMEVWTSEPGVQFYTGGYLDGAGLGKDGKPITAFSGFALETQRFPDTPNHPQFPSARLDPGAPYRHVMAFDFTPDARG